MGEAVEGPLNYIPLHEADCSMIAQHSQVHPSILRERIDGSRAHTAVVNPLKGGGFVAIGLE